MRYGWMLLAVMLVVPALLTADEKKDEKTTFTKNVKPILEANCIGCHKGEKAKAGLDMTSLETINKGSKKTKTLVVAGKPDESQLWKVCTPEGKPSMPPKAAKKRPSSDDVATIKKWIADGAKE